MPEPAPGEAFNRSRHPAATSAITATTHRVMFAMSMIGSSRDTLRHVSPSRCKGELADVMGPPQRPVRAGEVEAIEHAPDPAAEVRSRRQPDLVGARERQGQKQGREARPDAEHQADHDRGERRRQLGSEFGARLQLTPGWSA